MEQLKKIFSVVRRVVCSRVLAAALMGVFTVSMALAVSVNSRVTTSADNSRIVTVINPDHKQTLSAAGTMQGVVDQDAADIENAAVVEINADGVTTLLHLTEGTVEDAISRAGVTVGKWDTVNVELTAPVTDGMAIQVDRVAYEEYTVTESIDYETTYKYSSVLKPGQTKVRTHGEEGVRTITYRKIIVNGEHTATEKVGDAVTKKPVNKVVLKGTTLGTPMSPNSAIELDEGGQPVKYKKCLTGKATAYTADEGDSGSWTSTGKHVAVGLVAVNPDIIPYGSKLWITSADGSVVYGYAIAADTGGALLKNKVLVDLYMDTLVECNAFGRREMKVYILE